MPPASAASFARSCTAARQVFLPTPGASLAPLSFVKEGILPSIRCFKVPGASTSHQICERQTVLVKFSLYAGEHTLGQSHLNRNKLFSRWNEIQRCLSSALHYSDLS